MDFKQLETFQKVVEKKNYSDAAKALFVSQPTISTRLQSLQNELDVQLLSNNGRKVELTFAGSVFLEYVNEIMELKEEALKTIDKTKGASFNSLHISTTSIGTYIIPHISTAFQKSHPGVRLSLSFSNATAAIKQLFEKSTDLVVSPATLKNNKIISNVVGHDSLVLVASTNHPLSKSNDIIGFKELKKHQFIIREEGSDTRNHFKTWCEINNFHPRDLIEMDRSEAIKIAVSNNLGLALMSKFIIENDSRPVQFKILNVEGLPIHRPIQVLMLADQENNQLKQSFIRFLRDQLGG
ncbi:LysR family transcriptional regulator [Pseudobacillus badius]|uniref:LysR family transcriptional regulator n=1 Tax=Bacillus badius TaxID=1455 RepID=UPI001CC01660|nr:LysR family transcriptional regulator [Bacillus badius]UAT32421.1 LysR family transcriptional regulator [Bacillus badius]GLY12897.1 LysR family transcriptional regulator [Bacillus badius]